MPHDLEKYKRVQNRAKSVLRFLGNSISPTASEASIAADGQEAIDTFCQDPESIDCVLLDLSMPKLSGDEVHREMKAVRESVPIILMSGFAK